MTWHLSENSQPGLLLGHRLFEGLEQEGRFKGLWTLFVGDPGVTFDDVRNLLPKYEQVYLGGNRLSPVNFQLLRDLDLVATPRITVETPDLPVARLVLSTSTAAFVTLTTLMLDTQGKPVAPCVDLESAMKFYMEHKDRVQVKIDWGTHIAVIHNDQVTVNDFESYHNDRAL